MTVLALATSTGQPLSWLAAVVVALGLIGFAVGAIRARHRT